MPTPQPPQPLETVNLEHADFRFGSELLGDPRALSTVVQTFDKWSSSRQHNADKRWQTNDQMYLGIVEQRYWPDKKTKRSALGVPITFDQVESVYPILTRALFGRERWFGVMATPWSTPPAARALESALRYQFEAVQDENGSTPIRELKLTIKDFLTHGEGVAELGWNPARGNFFVENVPVSDFYFDPELGHPDIGRAQAVIRRREVSIESIRALRGVQPYNIPPDAVLAWAAQGKPPHPGELIDNAMSAWRGEQSRHSQPTNPDPALRTAEILEYWTDSRVIWILNRRVVILNGQNPYGIKPFVAAPAVILVGKAYGISLPDMLEGEQALIQGLTNAQVDEASLAVSPPRYRNPLAGNGPARNNWAPGMVEDITGDMKNVEIAWPQGMAQQTFGMIGMAQQRAMSRFGVNAMTTSGAPTPSNANRTLGGMARQEGGVLNRLQPLLENLEDYMILPALYKAQIILNKVLPSALPSIPAGPQEEVPRAVLGAPVRFTMKAASRLAARNELLQVLGPVSQTLLSDPVIQAAKAQGLTMDFSEWSRFFLDATTGEEYRFFRQMAPEEQQQAQQPDPETLARLQAQQQAEQTRREIAQAKNETTLTVAQIEAGENSKDRSERSATEILKILAGERSDKIKALTQERKDARPSASSGSK